MKTIMLKKLSAILFSTLSLVIGILSWLYPDPLSTGLFTFSYHKMIIVGIAVFATSIVLLIWFLLAHSQVGLFKRLITATLFCCSVLVSAAAGYQLGAPTYYFEGASLVKPDTPVSYATTKEQAGIRFSARGCSASGSLARCKFIVTSVSADRKIRFRDSTLVDERGNVSDIHNYIVGDKSIGRYGTVVLVADVETELALEFSNVSLNADYASLVSIKSSYSDLNNSISMRRLKIQR